MLPVVLTPSDHTLTLIARAHRLKSIDFIPLSRATSSADAKDVRVDHIRIKGANGDLLLDPSKSLTRKNSDFNRIPGAFLFAVKLLMRTYVLVSRIEERGAMWRPLQAAVRHITAVGNPPERVPECITVSARRRFRPK